MNHLKKAAPLVVMLSLFATALASQPRQIRSTITYGFQNNSERVYPTDMEIDPSNNIVSTGTFNKAVRSPFSLFVPFAQTSSNYLIKQNATGVGVWGITIPASTVYDNINDIAIDVSGDIYYAGRTLTSSGVSEIIFGKISSAGAILWHKTIPNSDGAIFS